MRNNFIDKNFREMMLNETATSVLTKVDLKWVRGLMVICATHMMTVDCPTPRDKRNSIEFLNFSIGENKYLYEIEFKNIPIIGV